MSDGEFIVIQIPSSFTYMPKDNLTSLCSDTTYLCTIYNSNNSIMVKSSSSNINSGIDYNFTITIMNNTYISPLNYNFKTENFLVMTFANATIDSIDPTNPQTNVTFSLTCIGQCRTCLPTNLSSCITCY
jgi:hypothetical protein